MRRLYMERGRPYPLPTKRMKILSGKSRRPDA
jgi:hypothetical protein